jgi:outer membrane receptor protein involved in Fe transport
VPLAPRFTVNGGVTARREDGYFGSLRVRAISARPANEDKSLRAAGYTVWDLQLGKRWEIPPDWMGGYVKAVTLRLDIQNLFDHDYREAQFATDSRLQSEPDVVSDIDFTPGYPLTAIGSLTVAF